LLAVGFSAAAAAAPVVYRIEPEFTYAEFAVSHIGLSRQRGHFGRTNGTIVLDPEQHSGSVDFVVDATSVDTGWKVRDEFLRGENMFDAAHFPVVRFHSTQLVFYCERLIGVAGELTLRDVTRPVALKVERLECGKEPDSGRDGCGGRSDVDQTLGLRHELRPYADRRRYRPLVRGHRVPRSAIARVEREAGYPGLRDG
jgi:polyisoprenoid-binding protein YceI